MAEQWNPTTVKPAYGKVVETIGPLRKTEPRGMLLAPTDYVGIVRIGEGFEDGMRDTFRNNYVFTGDIRLRNTSGDLKIVVHEPGKNDDLYFSLLDLINPKAVLIDGAVLLEDGRYDSVSTQAEGVYEITSGQLADMKMNKPLPEQEAIDHRIHRILYRDSTDLIKKNHGLARERTRNDKVMGVYLDDPEDKDDMRLWVVDALGDNGDVDGDIYLDGNNNRLVGLAPEALAAARDKEMPLETILRLAEHAQGVDRMTIGGEQYVVIPASQLSSRNA